MSCHSLLGLAFSLARGLDPLSEALNSGTPPQPSPAILESRKQDAETDGEGKPSSFRDTVSLNLYLIICWNVSRATWVFTEPSSVSKPAPLPLQIWLRLHLNCCAVALGRAEGRLWVRQIKRQITLPEHICCLEKKLPNTFNYILFK